MRSVIIVATLMLFTSIVAAQPVDTDAVIAAVVTTPQIFPYGHPYAKRIVIDSTTSNRLIGMGRYSSWPESVRATYDEQSDVQLRLTASVLESPSARVSMYLHGERLTTESVVIADLSEFGTGNAFDWERFRARYPNAWAVRLSAPVENGKDVFIRAEIHETFPSGLALAQIDMVFTRVADRWEFKRADSRAERK